MRLMLVLFAASLLLQQPPRISPIQDGEPHGDPPYLLEDGWEPLLNGTRSRRLAACDAGAKNEWFTTRSVRYERILGPTQLDGPRARRAASCSTARPDARPTCAASARSATSSSISSSCCAKGSNSGVYLQGLYEMQIFDSWGSTER